MPNLLPSPYYPRRLFPKKSSLTPTSATTLTTPSPSLSRSAAPNSKSLASPQLSATPKLAPSFLTASSPKPVARTFPWPLGEGALGRRRNASGHGNVRATGFGEEAVKKLGASFGVAESCGDAKDFEFGAAERESDGEGVVNVVADVGVNDDFFGKSLLG